MWREAKGTMLKEELEDGGRQGPEGGGPSDNTTTQSKGIEVEN